jgi:predicted nuclease of predicted toxin-antitoxin system
LAEVRYQFDEHVSHAIAAALRRDGIDVMTTTDAGLLGMPDVVQLAHAHASGRVLFTEDRDFLRLNRQGVEHSGIVYCARGSRTIGQVVAALTRIWREVDSEAMVGRVQFI